MTTTTTKPDFRIAGEVRASCSCCSEPRALANHAALDGPRRFCPTTHMTYLDRGDGLYEQEGVVFEPGAQTPTLPSTTYTPQASTAQGVGAVELLSDRPRRTGDKVRIELERATFAAFGAAALTGLIAGWLSRWLR